MLVKNILANDVSVKLKFCGVAILSNGGFISDMLVNFCCSIMFWCKTMFCGVAILSNGGALRFSLRITNYICLTDMLVKMFCRIMFWCKTMFCGVAILSNGVALQFSLGTPNDGFIF